MAAAALAALSTLGCSGGGERPDSIGLDPGESVTTAPAKTTTSEPPLTGKPLVISEQGVSSFIDPFDPGATLAGYGVVLTNPNADVLAASVRVTTRILDSTGAELLVDTTLLNAVMPGRAMALGRTLVEPMDDPTQLDIAVEVGAWLRPASADGALVVAEGVLTEPEENGGAVTRFTVRSTWPEPEEGVDVTAVYRAADGRILAAEYTTLPLVPPGGETAGQIRLLSPIPDLATTEVFVGRGLAAQTSG